MFSTMASSQQTVAIPISFQDGLSGYLGILAPTVGGAFRQEDRGDGIVWANNFLEIRATQDQFDGQNFVKLHVTSPSGAALGINAVFLRISVPAEGVDGVWTPSGRVPDDRLISADPGVEFVTYSAANFGIPYLAAAASGGRNLIALGLLEQDLTVQLRAAPAANGLYEFQLNASVPPNRTSLDQQFFVSNSGSYNWFNIAQKYADWVDAGTHYTPLPISDRAYTPVYDSWYWSKDDVNSHLYLRTGEAASQSGLGMFLVDSGWDAPTGEYDKWLLGSTGNYMPPPEKFPDLAGTFEALRSTFNLKINLWLQPFAVGRTSIRYSDTQAMHIQIPKNYTAALAPFDLSSGSDTLEDVNLCPQLSATHRYLRDLFAQIASAYHPDGYWLDFLDGMPQMCVAPHRHDFDTFGEGFRGAMTAIRDSILANDPSPVIEFRAQYANLNNKSFSNVWQPFDSPSNFDRMRLDALRLRPFSKGVVFAADELYWPDTLGDARVARFAMTDVMTGVPSIGANLLALRPSSNEIVKNWMSFYKTYQQDLTTGVFQPFGSFRVPNHSIESDSRIFVYIRSKGQVNYAASRGKEIFLMNASDAGHINASISLSRPGRYKMLAYNHYLQPQGAATEVPTASGVLDINAVVQRGGMLVLTPVSDDQISTPETREN